MSFLNHPLFPAIRPFMYAQRTGAYDNVRLQLRRRKMPAAIKAKLSHITTRCVACGELMHPLRNGKYFAATCRLEDNISCSRTAKASLEYWAIKQNLETIFIP